MSETPSGDPPPAIPSDSAGPDANESEAKDTADAAPPSSDRGGANQGSTPSEPRHSEGPEDTGADVNMEGATPPSAPREGDKVNGAGEREIAPTDAADGAKQETKTDCANAGNEDEDEAADPSKYRRTRSSSFDARDESGIGKTAVSTRGDDNASDRGDRASIGPESTRGVSSRGQARDDFGALSALVDAGSELAMRSTTSGPGTYSVKEGTGGIGTVMSFLDALSEEERRVRTRHVPTVEGFRALHRSEIRRDLALARSIMNSSGGGITKMSAGKAAKGRRSSGLDENENESKCDEDKIDVDDEDGTGMSDDDLTSEVSSGGGAKGSSKSSRSDSAATGPSPAFVPPLETSTTVLSASDSADQTYGLPGQSQAPRPHVIESITAFNPPRPPESIGPKKKHRLLRWERTPHDVEVDLNNYRKTVQRTREELHNAEHERERIEIAGGHLRSHFLSHLKALREESALLNQELNSVQSDCVKRADLPTSKTRSFDGCNGTKVMMDVLSVLKSRGGTTSAGIREPQACGTSNKPWCSSGVGGVTAKPASEGCASSMSSFLANGWILPGEKVSTPNGTGTVIDVSGPSMLDSNESPPEGMFIRTTNWATGKASDSSSAPAASTQRHGFGGTDAQPVPSSSTGQAHDNKDSHGGKLGVSAMPSDVTSGEAPASVKSGPGSENAAAVKSPKFNLSKEDKTKADSSVAKKSEFRLLPPRVCVRMSHGVAYFSPDDVSSLENPAFYSDEKLVNRWQKMVESAKSMGCCIDVMGLDKAAGTTVARSSSISSGGVVAEEAKGEKNNGETMEVDTERGGGETGDAGQPDEGETKDSEEYGNPTKAKMGTNRTLAIGSAMLLSPGLRGFSLANIPTDKLESCLDPMLFDGKGVLGRNDNPGLPSDVKQWEDVRFETQTLRGRAMQLRNELYRQRRIRMLNERTRHVGQERAERVEGLLAEMKADLTSCKERLKQELAELGIDQERAADLLTTYMKEQENAPMNNVFVPKKRTKNEPKPESNIQPRISRRRGGLQQSSDGGAAASLQDADSSDINAAADAGIVSERDDEMNPRRKRGRGDVDSLEGSKPKRGGYRRQ